MIDHTKIMTHCNITQDAAGHWPDFHELRASQVSDLLEVADELKYRAPRNANGSRARYFYAGLTRQALRA